MGNDHRTRVTKILIRKAFTDLLKKKAHPEHLH